MASLDFAKEQVERIVKLPIMIDFTWPDCNAPECVTVRIRNTNQCVGEGFELHQFACTDSLVSVSVGEELAAKLCHGKHQIDVLTDGCNACASKCIFMDYSCPVPECEISDVNDCPPRIKCNV